MAIVGVPQKQAAPQRPPMQQPSSPPPQRAGTSKLFGGRFADTMPADVKGDFFPTPPEGQVVNMLVRINQSRLRAQNQAQFDEAPDVYEKVSWKGKETCIVQVEVLSTDWDVIKVGAIHSWITVDRDDKFGRKEGEDSQFAAEIKGYICGVFGAEDPKQVDESDLRDVFGPTQAAAGKVAHLMIRAKKLRDKPGYFTQHVWKHYEESAEASA